jgi:ferredoxin-like protein FixX
MEKIDSKKRIAMKTYIKNDDALPVHQTVVSDDKSGLLLANALIENTFDYGFKYLTPPEDAEDFGIPGVYLILPDSSEDILLVFSYTLDRTIHLICNDESQAKNQFEKVIVKPADCFKEYDHELTFSQAWTLEERVVRIFYNAIGISNPATFTNL